MQAPRSGSGQDVSETGIREVRRWLWEQSNARQGGRRSPPELVATLWSGDAGIACRSLAHSLEVLVKVQRCTAEDAETWSVLASLTGERTSKRLVAFQRRLSERGLDKRLSAVDKLLAQVMSAKNPPVQQVAVSTAELAVQGLIDAAQAKLHGQVDAADGIYQAAEELAGVPPEHRAAPSGRDRTRRARAKHRALAAMPLRVNRSAVPLDLGPPPADGKLVPVHYQLHDEPGQALAELNQAKQAGAVHALPVLLDHALKLMPNADAAGVANRLSLLGLGSTILRECESILALPWSTAWLREAMRYSEGTDLQVVMARRTRAHVLQLHGFLSLAGHELTAARTAIDAVRMDDEHRTAELVDLLLRQTSVNVALASGSAVNESEHLLREAFAHEPNEGLLPGLLRNKLQIASIRAAAHRRRRTFGGRTTSDYESALAALMAVLENTPASPRHAIWSSLLAAAIRVGDTSTVELVARAVLRDSGPGSANLLDRLRQHLYLAAQLPGLKEIRDVHVVVPDHPLRRPDLLPQAVRYLV